MQTNGSHEMVQQASQRQVEALNWLDSPQELQFVRQL